MCSTSVTWFVTSWWFPLEAGGAWDPAVLLSSLHREEGRLSLERSAPWTPEIVPLKAGLRGGSIGKTRFADWRDQRAAVLGSNQQLTGEGSGFNGKLYKIWQQFCVVTPLFLTRRSLVPFLREWHYSRLKMIKIFIGGVIKSLSEALQLYRSFIPFSDCLLSATAP